MARLEDKRHLVTYHCEQSAGRPLGEIPGRGMAYRFTVRREDWMNERRLPPVTVTAFHAQAACMVARQSCRYDDDLEPKGLHP